MLRKCIIKLSKSNKARVGEQDVNRMERVEAKNFATYVQILGDRSEAHILRVRLSLALAMGPINVTGLASSLPRRTPLERLVARGSWSSSSVISAMSETDLGGQIEKILRNVAKTGNSALCEFSYSVANVKCRTAVVLYWSPYGRGGDLPPSYRKSIMISHYWSLAVC